MPSRPLRPCARPGCPGLTREGKWCAACGEKRAEDPERKARDARHDRERGSAASRGYGHRWRKLRLMVLREEPLCRECLAAGTLQPAAEVDHILSKRRGGTDERTNLQGLCKPCHSRKTWLEDRLVPVTVVAGPPGAGKTTYVREHMQSGDLVVDVDALWSALSLCPWYDKPEALLPFVCAARDAVLERLGRAAGVRQAWVVTADPDRYRLKGLVERLGARLVVIELNEGECLARIARDERRSGTDPEHWREVVSRWWATYGPPRQMAAS